MTTMQILRQRQRLAGDMLTFIPDDEEYEIGDEDRVFRAGVEWYWQARGTDNCCGPFNSRLVAETDYKNT